MTELTSGIEQPIQAFYEVISGYAGQPRDLARLRSLFISGAKIIPSSVVNGAAPQSAVEIDAYIERLAGFLGQHDFFETGIIQHVEVYDHIASVISTYEARHTPEDPLPFKRGVNYIHLLNDGTRWRLAGMIWCDEKKGIPIPEQ